MRFDLFALVLRFTPEALRTVKSSETATIIKDEVEPIGGFIGDAFITPVFLGTQAITALVFIVVQNALLGLMAVLVIGIQFVVIPRMRRELLRLGKQRQIASRKLAGRVSEVMDGIEAVHVHNSQSWERAEIGQRLYELFDLRFQIYERKFMVKFLNNFLAQLTPFLFYAIGGYFALRGRLDIGQLVAVIGAYRELPPPLKELIDWDQQRLDVQVKYDQVVQHFSPERLLPVEEAIEEQDVEDAPLIGPLVGEELRVADPHGGLVLDGAKFSIDLPARVAIVSDGSAVASILARIIGRRTSDFTGVIRIGERDFVHLPASVTGRRLAYAGVDPILFPGSIRENLIYGLRHRPVSRTAEDEKLATRRVTEALRTGNPIENIADRWIDFELVGATDEADLDRVLLDLLRRVGLQDDVYRFGLSGMFDPREVPQIRRACRRRAGAAARSPARQRRVGSRRALRSQPLQRSGDARRKPVVRRADPARTDGTQSRRKPPLPRDPGAGRHFRRPHRHGLADRRDDDGNLPRRAARPSIVRAVLLHRCRRTCVPSKRCSAAMPTADACRDPIRSCCSRCRSPMSSRATAWVSSTSP